MAFSIRCPVCRQKFPWEPKAGFPEMCPNEACQSRIAHDRADDDVVLPFMRTSEATKRTDQVYRDMERGSEIRAQLAAEQLGVPVSDMSALKITDLQSTKIPGSIAAPPVNNEVTRFMAQHNISGHEQGQAYAANVSRGPYPRAGMMMRDALRQRHGQVSNFTAVSDIGKGVKPR